MTVTNVLHRWLEMAGHDEIVVDPADIVHEARANMWHFSPSDEESNQITVAGVEQFIGEIIKNRKANLNGREMLFYCWHDAQARQLRFSLISKSHNRLPFGCTVKQTFELSSVIEHIVHNDWLNDQYFQESCGHAECEGHVECQVPFVLLVFVANLAG